MLKAKLKPSIRERKFLLGFSILWTNLGASRRGRSSFGAWGDSPGTGLKATRMENGNSDRK